MAPKEKRLSILEVLDSLNAIVEADSLDEIEVTGEFQFIPHKPDEEAREFLWIRAGPNNLTMEAIRENFRAALKYLNAFYERAESEQERRQILEGVNAIMVLVGEASSKLGRFDFLFKDNIPKLNEYKDLKDFYKRISVVEGAVAEEPLAEFLPGEEMVEEVEGVHLLNDIEAVKKDHIYELFYLQNEAGLDFYTEALARSMKVACDFGQFAKEEAVDDPLVQIKNWEDKGLQVMAKRLFDAIKADLDSYYKEASHFKEIELVALFQRALFALMLAANPRNLIRQFASKGCYQYFADFLAFMRELLVHREFVRYVLYRSAHAAPFFSEMSKVVFKLVFLLYTTGPDRREIKEFLKELIGREGKKEEKLSIYLKSSYGEIERSLEKHPSGPLFKALDLLRDEMKPAFDPLMLGNIPEMVGSLYLDEKVVTLLRLPAPVMQERIDRAILSDEFRTFLTEMSAHGQKLLYIDFQDRTSWREHSRVKVLESFSKEAEYQGVFSYVNLAKETDFYNQQSLYRDLSDSSEFIRQFYLHLSDESAGYYFSAQLKKELFPNFVEKLMAKIWKEFFDNKGELNLDERLSFIDLIYHFIALKVVELEKPDYLTLTSKDGLDTAAAAFVGFLSLIKLGGNENWKGPEREELRTLLVAPTLLQRERLILPDKFSRLINLLHLLEEREGFIKAFSSLFEKKTVDMKVASLA